MTVVYNTVPTKTQDRVLKIRDGALPTSPVIHSQIIPYNTIVLGANVFTITAPVGMNANEVNCWEITDSANTSWSAWAADGISLNANGAYSGGNAWFVPSAPSTYDITFAVQIGPTCVTSNGIDTRTECDSLTWLDGITYTSNNNTATHLIPGGTSNGCDSLVTLDLTIVSSTTGIDTRTECNSLVWIDGLTYTTSNNTATYSMVGAASNGCDSLVSLDLTIINSATSTDSRTECDSLVWIDGLTYKSSNNTATYNLPGAASNGCDSLVSLDLTIMNSATGTDTRNECKPFTWIDGITYTASNTTATHNLTGAAANGCDSLVSLDLTYYTPTGIDTRTTCDSLTWIDGITYFSDNNTATFNIVGGSAQGCDSLVTLDLTVINVDRGITQSGTSLSSNATGATYQWLDCDNAYSPIPGETAKTFNPQSNGNYAVAVTQNNCSDTSSCININSIGIVENSALHNVIIYPNPASELLTIECSGAFVDEVSIIDLTGKIYQIEKKGKTVFDISRLPKGIYFIHMSKDNEIITEKLIKN